jgi:hypothetical protein
LTLQWVKGHADTKPWEDTNKLFERNLSRDKIFNVWCDRAAKKAWDLSYPMFDQDVTPGGKWAISTLHPVHHKIIGNLSESIYASLGYDQMLTYIQQKHNISMGLLEKKNTTALEKHLQSLKIFQCASIIKLTHGWIPTYGNLCQ